MCYKIRSISDRHWRSPHARKLQLAEGYKRHRPHSSESTWFQFHQHFTPAFLYQSSLRRFSLIAVIFWCKKIGPKTAHKMLIKLSPCINFINIYTCLFVSKCFVQIFPNCSNFWCKKIGAKTAHKMLMKLSLVSITSTFYACIFCKKVL